MEHLSNYEPISMLLSTKHHTLCRFPVKSLLFFCFSLFLPNVRFLFQNPICVTLVDMSSFICNNFSDFPCLRTLMVLWSTSQIFCRMSLSWDLSDFFLMVRLGNVSERMTTEVKCHSHYIISRVCIIKMTSHR